MTGFLMNDNSKMIFWEQVVDLSEQSTDIVGLESGTLVFLGSASQWCLAAVDTYRGENRHPEHVCSYFRTQSGPYSIQTASCKPHQISAANPIVYRLYLMIGCCINFEKRCSHTENHIDPAWFWKITVRGLQPLLIVPRWETLKQM